MIKKHFNTINNLELLYFLSTGSVPRMMTLLKDSEKNTESFNIHSNKLEIENSFQKELIIFEKKINDLIKNFIIKNKGPYGVFLSGGIDSTSILHTLRENTNKEIYTISFIFDETETESISLIDEIVQKYNTIHKYIKLNNDDFYLLDFLEKRFKNPIMFGYGLIMDYLGVKYFKDINILNVLTGYGDFFISKEPNIYYLNIFKKIENQIDIIDAELNEFKNWNQLMLRNKSIFLNDYLKLENGYFTLSEISGLFRNGGDLVKYAPCINEKNPDFISDITTFNCKYIYDGYPESYEKAAKDFGVNLYHPFCDEEFTQYILSIPSEFKVHFFEMKYILRECYKEKIPEKVFYKNYSIGNPNFTKILTDEKIIDFIKKKIEYLNKTGLFKNKLSLERIYGESEIENEAKILILIGLSSWLEGKNILSAQLADNQEAFLGKINDIS